MTACKADGCENNARRKGLCGKHYARLYRHGDYGDPAPIGNQLAEIKDYLAYDPETGEFRWIAKPRGARGNPVVVGSVAGGRMGNGYISICFARERWYAHRLAWWWVHGEMPARLDHKNGVKTDNRIQNLRPASGQQNAANMRGQCGRKFKGAYFRKKNGRWQGAIGVDGRFVHLGYFDTEEAAARAYDRAAIEHFGAFAHLNFGGHEHGRIT